MQLVLPASSNLKTPVSVWSNTLTLTDGSEAGYSHRTVHVIGTGSGGTEIRVKFKSGTGLDINNAAVGVQSAAEVTAATPVELTFDGGSSGYTFSSGEEKWSDWVSLATANPTTLIVVTDQGSPSNQVYENSGGEGVYYQAAAASYADAAPSGSWTYQAAWSRHVIEIEVR